MAWCMLAYIAHGLKLNSMDNKRVIPEPQSPLDRGASLAGNPKDMATVATEDVQEQPWKRSTGGGS